MKASEAISRTRQLISTRGWGQKRGWDVSGGERIAFCVVGALETVTMGCDIAYFAARLLIEQACNYDGHVAKCSVDVVAWNDMPGRTQQQVLQMLDRAIELAEQGER